ncbi:hypothetical protein K1T71_008877 [Dendrolimus kikuchii]|uniref:Uncharacterized protein n=1 Tax=Dendrolimus kikuchii TaxID=765133 RepID=A0ACC1CVM6_9NEOP|nr:hypothetical protein K1T71_008877 [Dendrolimus kikuchii]
MLNLETATFGTPILSRSKMLLKVRLWFYFLSYVHLVTIAGLLLTIDFSNAEDPRIKQYQETRWKLLTAWFNLITLLYFPTCFYCDWRELRGEANTKHVKLLNQFRYLAFTGILLPTTAFGDILFWRIWNKDRELIAPAEIDTLVPFWTQHCMHTISLVIMLIDLVLVPRERPKNMFVGFGVLTTFLTVYIFVCTRSFLHGELIYPGLKLFTGYKFLILVAYVYIENFFYYTSQWLIVDIVWGHGNKKIA